MSEKINHNQEGKCHAVTKDKMDNCKNFLESDKDTYCLYLSRFDCLTCFCDEGKNDLP